MNNDILFDFNQSNLKAEALNALNDINKYIIEKQNFSKIMVAGYTDDVGSESYNLSLSLKRAQSVAQWMIDHGVKQSMLEVKGLGKQNPKVPA